MYRLLVSFTMRQPLAMIYHVQPKLAEEERTEIQSTEHRVIVEIVESFLYFRRLYLPRGSLPNVNCGFGKKFALAKYLPYFVTVICLTQILGYFISLEGDFGQK